MYTQSFKSWNNGALSYKYLKLVEDNSSLSFRCKQDCCEEDVDWKVEAVPGKGLGIVALKDIQPLAKIMVDRGYTR